MPLPCVVEQCLLSSELSIVENIRIMLCASRACVKLHYMLCTVDSDPDPDSDPDSDSDSCEKPKLIDPLDYEAVISELEPELKDDPLKDLLLFPEHDFTVSTLVSVCLRTLQSTVPGGAEEQAECLLVREACRYYNSQLHVVEYKHQEYAGDYGMLSR
uniref:Dedicator of cytokinesis C/D N-terminal domain-containing protein n=1 Tax=Electrophorus electricus TaxID=8005 RepID=A0AAY5E7I4_ELEEL